MAWWEEEDDVEVRRVQPYEAGKVYLCPGCNQDIPEGTGHLVVVPVAAPDSLELVRPFADETVCLEAPADFYAVGQFYRDFPQVEDAEVIALLAKRP